MAKKSVDEYIKVVRESNNLDEQREALIELGYQKDKRVYPLLVEQLSDRSDSIQHAAVISLGRYGNPEAIEELVKPKIIRSPVVNVRWAAIISLGMLGDRHIVDHLLKGVDDPEWIVRNQTATEIKGKIREIIECRECEEFWNIRILVRLLALDNEEIVDLAIEGLSALKEKSVGLLLETLKSSSALMRKNAAKALGQIRAVQVVDALIDLLKDPEWKVRKSAVEALGNMGEKESIEPLVQRLCDNVENVRKQAQHSLIGFGKLSTQPLLDALSHEKDKFTLRDILITLGEIGDYKAVPEIIDHLRSSYFVVRVAAVRALIKFGHRIVDDLIPLLSYNQSDIRQFMKDASNHDKPLLQLRSVKALGALEDHRAVGLLKNLVENGSPDVQEAAEHALVQIGCAAWKRCGALMVLSEVGDQSLIFHLIHSLGDDSNNVRLEAVRALANIDGHDVIQPLISVAEKDRDPDIRFEAIRRLRVIGVGYPDVLKFALSALKDPSLDVRSQAARLLGNFHDDRSIQPLLKATADSHWSVRESAELALMNFGEQAVPHLIKALSSRFWTTRFRVARLLGELGDIKAIDALETLLRKKGEHLKVRKIAQDALKNLRKIKAA